MKGSDAPLTPKGRMVRTPDEPRIPHKSFRIPEDLYRAGLAAAKQRGETLSDLVRRSIRDYVEQTTIE